MEDTNLHFYSTKILYHVSSFVITIKPFQLSCRSVGRTQYFYLQQLN